MVAGQCASQLASTGLQRHSQPGLQRGAHAGAAWRGCNEGGTWRPNSRAHRRWAARGAQLVRLTTAAADADAGLAAHLPPVCRPPSLVRLVRLLHCSQPAVRDRVAWRASLAFQLHQHRKPEVGCFDGRSTHATHNLPGTDRCPLISTCPASTIIPN